MSITAIFSAAIALLGAMPGAIQALEGLAADIKGHSGIPAEDKVTLLAEIAQVKAAVDAEDDEVQAIDIPNPKPTV